MPDYPETPMPWEDLSPLGDGPIEPSQLPEQVRKQRHHIRAVETAQAATIDLVRRSLNTGEGAHDLATENHRMLVEIRADLYGDAERPGDVGDIGALRHSLNHLDNRVGNLLKMGWAILLMLIATLAGLLGNLYSLHH